MNISEIECQIFDVNENSFEELAITIFKYQATHVDIYKKYLDLLKISIESVNKIVQIPFLPISFFKTNQVVDDNHKLVETIFESSGTTGEISSKHFVLDTKLYEKSFSKTFINFFGNPNQYCILGLLPSYLEKGNSSLVYMVNSLIQKSNHEKSGFYLHDFDKLKATIIDLEEKKQDTLLFGVTYALLDFADFFSMELNYVKIIETGGMKGRKEELTRSEIHKRIKKSFLLPHVFSEYGMTELLSQGYSLKEGIYQLPNWMKIVVREINDPFSVQEFGKGAINIIDLANIHSCSFIATDDYGEVFSNHSFIIQGRIEQSEIRGCSLLAL